jgi:hypothetical protein
LLLSIPVALVEAYEQPEPQPSAAMVDKIKEAVARLNADDWKDRDKAGNELQEMGVIVGPVLKQLRASQSPEAQQRIDQILQAVSGSKNKPSAASVNPQPEAQ